MNRTFIILGIIGLGVILRLSPAMARDFPINDGGMFYSMTKQLEANHFALPKTAEYNHLGIAYAYPPLAFITTGLLDKLGKWSLLDIYRLLPPVLACVTLIPFYWLARILLKSKNKAAAALLVYASLPSAYYTLIAGGGMTRAIGMILALFTLLLYLAGFTQKKNWYITAAGVFLAGTFTAHLEMSVFAAVGLAIITAFYKIPSKKLVIICAAAVALCSWWWGIVIWESGWRPFLAALQSNPVNGESLMTFLFMTFTREQTTALFTVMGMLGFLTLIAKGNWLVPIWLLLMFLSLWRGPETTATVIIALAAGDYARNFVTQFKDIGGWFKNLYMGILIIWLAGNIFGNILDIVPKRNEWVESLSHDDRNAFGWIRNNTGINEKFLIYSGVTNKSWASDAVSEWFPAMTGRTSILTIQGTEWKTGIGMTRYKALGYLHNCFNNIDCLDNLNQKYAENNYNYIYVSNQETCVEEGCNLPMDLAYLQWNKKKLDLVYAGKGVRIWRKF